MARTLGKEFAFHEIGDLTPLDLIALAGGGYVLSFASYQAEPGAMPQTGLLKLDARGRPVGDVFTASKGDDGNETAGALLALSDGGFAVAWVSGVNTTGRFDTPGNIRFFKANGKPDGDTIQFTADANRSFTTDAVLTETPEGVRVFYSGNPEPFKFPLIAVDVTNEGVVSSPYRYDFERQGNAPSATLLENGKHLAVTGAGSGQVTAHLIRADGELVWQERIDYFGVPYLKHNIASEQTVTRLETGGYVVTWDEGGVWARRFDVDGTPIGNRTQLNDTTASTDHDVISLPSGGFLLSWVEPDDRFANGTGWVAHAQEFGPTGQPIGKEITLAGNLDDQRSGFPHLAQGTDGTVLAVFGNSNPRDGETEARLIKTAKINNFPGTIEGTRKEDVLKGSGKADDIFDGRAGSDKIIGKGGHDELHGGKGGDLLLGGKGNDILEGGKGNDVSDVSTCGTDLMI